MFYTVQLLLLCNVNGTLLSYGRWINLYYFILFTKLKGFNAKNISNGVDYCRIVHGRISKYRMYI